MPEIVRPEIVRTEVAIAGGGPAGIMLGLLLARRGIDMTVLEKHGDFFRDFRGDTVHPSTLNLIDALGLRDRFDAIAHHPLPRMDAVIQGIRVHLIDFTTLPPPNRFVTLMPQWDLLDLLAAAAKQHPSFHLRMDADATGLVERDGRVAGIRAATADGGLTVEADLVVAADGRDSTLRAAAGLVPRRYDVDLDVVWFRLPRPARPLPDTLGWAGPAGLVVTIPRPEYLQCGLLIPKGTFDRLRAEGVAALRDRIVRVVPRLREVVGAIGSFDDVKLLSVQIERLRRWWRPGLLCIGDAAHAMSPVFGVGINYAIQDAVAAARVIAPALRTPDAAARAASAGARHDRRTPNAAARAASLDRACAAVQRRRAAPTAAMQAIQRRAHRFIGSGAVGRAIDNPPTSLQRAVLRFVLPLVRPLAMRMVAYGFHPERL